MPLENGSSKEVIQRNIHELINSGHSPDQAAAIAYKTAGKTTDDEETYLDLLQLAKKMENDAIEIGLKLVAAAPPEDVSQLLEITADENGHDRIYTEMLLRYQNGNEVM